MIETLYKIVFSGRLVPGFTGRQALANLAKVSRRSPDEIRALFSRPGRVLRRNLPLAKAERVLSDLLRAGVVCQIQEMPPEASEQSQEAPVVETPRILSVVEDGPNVLTLIPVTPDSTLTPIECGFLTAVEGGLETPRLDRSFIAYSDILAATLFAPEEGGGELMLLLFSVGNKRPLIIQGERIAFHVFPDVPSENLPTSICNFLYFLAAQNADFCVDEKTDLYMSGVHPEMYCANQLLLAYAVYAALGEIHEDLERTPLPAPPPGAAAALSPVAQLAVDPGEESEDPLGYEEAVGIDIVRGIDKKAELEGWVDRWTWPLVSLLLAGLFVPQFKRGVPTDNQALSWFWDVFGAHAVDQNLPLIAMYTLLPLISAVLILLTQFASPKRWRGGLLFVAGLLPLVLIFTPSQGTGNRNATIISTETLSGEGLVLMFLLMLFLLVGAVGCLNKLAIVHAHLKFLQKMAGVILVLGSALAIILVDWNDAGAFFAQMGDHDTGAIELVLSVSKALLIYGGMALTAGVGLVHMLGRRYAGRL